MGGKTGTTTSSVAIPPEVLARYNAVNTQAQATASTPFQQYSTDPNAFVAPLNEQQQAGINNINQQANAAQPGYQAAMAGTAGASQGYNAQNYQQDVQGYMNPYLQNAMGSTAAMMNQQNQQQQQQLQGSAIQQGAFGGDRGNVAQAALMGQQNLAMGQTLGQMANTGYQSAAQNYMTGLGQQGALAQQYGNLAGAAQTAGLQGAQAQVGAGTLGQQTTQAGQSALYNQFQQQQAYPFQVSQFLANIAEGTGALSGSTTTTTAPQSWFSSDARLKEDIKRVGTAKNGLPIYTFKYKGDDTEQTHTGYMAQDVEKVHPEAVGESNGFKTVNYEQASEPVHRAFGGAANSEGGVVSPQHAAEGYFNGGDVVSPYDLSAILASQQQSYAPFTKSGIYGGSPAGTPGGKGVVPAANLPVAHLGIANPARAQQGDTLMGDVQGAMNIGDTIKKANEYRKDIVGQPAQAAKAAVPASGDTPAQAAVAAQPSTGMYGFGDLLKQYLPQGQAHGGVVGYADGGGVEPYQTDDPMSQVVSDTEKDKGQHGLMTAQNPTGQPSSTLGDLSKIAAIPGEISGLGTMASAVGSGVGAAASGIGSFLSSLGPFALALKDGGVVPREHHDGSEGNIVGGGSEQGDNVVGDTGPQLPNNPNYYKAQAEQIAKEKGIDPDQFVKLIGGESGFVPHSGDDSSSAGVMQNHIAGASGQYPNAGRGEEVIAKYAPDEIKNGTPEQKIAWMNAPGTQLLQMRDAAGYIKESGAHPWTVAREQGLFGEPQPKQAPTAPGSNAAAAPTSIGDWVSKQAQDPNMLLSILSGLGTMAGSNSRYLGAAILQGIGGGAEMYKGLQQQGIERQRVGIEGLKANADVQAKNLEVLKYYQGNFTPALNATGQKIYRNKLTGEEVSPEQYNAIMSGVAGQVTSGGGVGGASSVALGAPPAGGVVPPAATPTPPPAGTATQAPAATTASQPPPMAISDSDIAAHQTDYNWLMQNAQKLRNQAQTFVGVNKDQQDLLENRANDMQNRAAELMNTPQATPLGSRYVIRPGYQHPKDAPSAPIDETTPRGQLDPNTGKIISAPQESRDIGFHSTGGFYPDTYPPNALPIENGDARVMAQKAAQAGTQQDFETAAQGTQTGISSIIKFATAAQQLESKGLNMTKAEYSNMLRGLGLGSAADMVENQQDDAAAYTATKAALDSAISTSNAAFSKPTQSEFGTIAEKGSPNIDAPVDTSHSLAQTRLAGFLWQQQLYHDWKQDQQTQGVSNFGSYLDRWKALHPSSMFEDAADRLLGNFKGQDLPNNKRFAEGVTYVVPDKASNNPSSEAIRQYAIDQGLKPGDIFTVNGVKHNQDGSGSFFKIKKIDPKDAYRTHLSAPGLQYGN